MPATWGPSCWTSSEPPHDRSPPRRRPPPSRSRPGPTPDPGPRPRRRTRRRRPRPHAQPPPAVRGGRPARRPRDPRRRPPLRPCQVGAVRARHPTRPQAGPGHERRGSGTPAGRAAAAGEHRTTTPDRPPLGAALPRPTIRDLADAHEDVEALAYAHDPEGSPRLKTGFPELAKAANLFAWLIGEIKASDRAAAFGPGVRGGYHTLQRGSTPTDLDARTHDAYAKALRNLLAGWRVGLGQLVGEMEQEAMDVGRYPTRTEQASA